MSNQKPKTIKPKTKTENPKPKTQNPKPKPKTQNPKPKTKTQNPKPKTQNPKPAYRHVTVQQRSHEHVHSLLVWLVRDDEADVAFVGELLGVGGLGFGVCGLGFGVWGFCFICSPTLSLQLLVEVGVGNHMAACTSIAEVAAKGRGLGFRV